MCMKKVFTYHTLLCKRLLSAPGYTEGRSVGLYGRSGSCLPNGQFQMMTCVGWCIARPASWGSNTFGYSLYVYIDAFRLAAPGRSIGLSAIGPTYDQPN